MALSFVAKGDLLVSRPNVWLTPGQPAQYVGRAYDPVTKAYPAKSEPEIYSDPKDMARLVKLVRREACLYPADAATAEQCGVPFIPVEFCDGAWVPAKPKARKTSKA